MSENKQELVITRVFDAPRELVWKMWTDPEMAKKWWGPKTFTAPVCKMDLRVGGKYHNCMQDASGNNYWSTGTYREIVPNEKLVMTDSFADEHGNVVPATHYGIKDFPLECLVTVVFEEVEGKTKMTLTHSGIEGVDEQMLKNMDQGWKESFDKLSGNLK